eukprot:gnl/MRDRNA2_/MRDRNA2_30309_c0_seq1.p1 gnl/MRDRNA2_/MRDRNA2_30309_c0~~gnl/MRDRNA2_/MRDRNA2_30309_c0_seq1.p1  ORF type:complete len:586 (+),score=127.81 gnl/MRDRNA2_/MRDRNA2_30309_c0_seq1:73-1830(+)
MDTVNQIESSGDERSLLGEQLRTEMAKMREEVNVLRGRPDNEETKTQVAALRAKMFRMREEVHRLAGGSVHDSDQELPQAPTSPASLEMELTDAQADATALLERLDERDADEEAQRQQREQGISQLANYRKMLEEERQKAKIQELELREAHKQVRQAWERNEQLEGLLRNSARSASNGFSMLPPGSDATLPPPGTDQDSVGAAEEAGGVGAFGKPTPGKPKDTFVPVQVTALPSARGTGLPSARDQPSARDSARSYNSQLSARRPARSHSPPATGRALLPMPQFPSYQMRNQVTPGLPAQMSVAQYPFPQVPGNQQVVGVQRLESASSGYSQGVSIMVKGGGEIATVPGGPDAAGGSLIDGGSPVENVDENVSPHTRVCIMEKRVAALQNATTSLERRAREPSVEPPPNLRAAPSPPPVVRLQSAPRGYASPLSTRQPWQAPTPRPQMSPLGTRNPSPPAARVTPQISVDVDSVLGKAKQALQDFDRIQAPVASPAPSPPPRASMDTARVAGSMPPWSFGYSAPVPGPQAAWGARITPPAPQQFAPQVQQFAPQVQPRGMGYQLGSPVQLGGAVNGISFRQPSFN